MENFAAYCLRFQCRAQTEMAVPRHKGSMLRGAIYRALLDNHCVNKGTSCLACPLNQACPISKLAATVDKENKRGAEVPRPFALQPDLSTTTHYSPDDMFTFGITLFGDSLALFPYLILALRYAGEKGIGNRSLAPGVFSIEEASEINELTQTERVIYRADQKDVSLPSIPITNAQVMVFAERLSAEDIGLRFLTPLRLISRGALVKRLTFPLLAQRLLRRLSDLYWQCCHTMLDFDFRVLLEKAATVSTVDNETNWLDLASYSRRQGRATPIGGLIGNVSFHGEIKTFLPYLVWGQFTHVGKDVTKGNGWYQIIATS